MLLNNGLQRWRLNPKQVNFKKRGEKSRSSDGRPALTPTGVVGMCGRTPHLGDDFLSVSLQRPLVLDCLNVFNRLQGPSASPRTKIHRPNPILPATLRASPPNDLTKEIALGGFSTFTNMSYFHNVTHWSAISGGGLPIYISLLKLKT